MTAETSPKTINALLNSVVGSNGSTGGKHQNGAQSSSLRHSPTFRHGSRPRSSEENTLMGSLIPRKIFVGGIAEETLDTDMRAVFSQFGSVQDIRIITDRSMTSKAGEPRRFAFVEFASEDEVKTVLEEFSRRELELHGRRLNIGQAYRKVSTFGRVFTPTSHSDTSSSSTPGLNTSANSSSGYSFTTPPAQQQNSIMMNHGRVPQMTAPQFPFFPYQYPPPAFTGFPYMPMLPPHYPPPITPPMSPQQLHQQQLLFQQAYGAYNGMTMGNHIPPRECARPEVVDMTGSGGYNGGGHGSHNVSSSSGSHHGNGNERMNFGMLPEMGSNYSPRHGHRDLHQPMNNSLTVQNLVNQEYLLHLNNPLLPAQFPDMQQQQHSRPNLQNMYMGAGNALHPF